MRGPLALTCIAALSVQAQTAGRLVYVTGPGRVVRLDVLDGNHQAFVTLPVLQGQAGTLRDFVLAHTGPERVVAPQAKVLPDQAPAAWKVRWKRGQRLLGTPEVIYWSYTPGLLLPVRFTLGKDLWRLQSADLPPRMFVSLDGR